jgi:hypothetical protein
MHLAAALDGEGSVPIEFQFVLEIRALRQLFGAQEEHRFDEFGDAGHRASG